MSAAGVDEKRRIPWAEARDLATDLVGMLSPFCERIEVAGSIRRRCVKVGDVELVCVPRIEQRPSGMFGDTEPANLQLLRVKELIEEGVLACRPNKNGHTTCGAGAQYLSYKGFPVDVFGVIAPSQWGVIFAIRTGPSEFSHKKLVMPRALGGLLQTGQRVKDGQLWDLGRSVPLAEEREFFEAIGCPYIEPENRR